jgi:hypothetical protein
MCLPSYSRRFPAGNQKTSPTSAKIGQNTPLGFFHPQYPLVVYLGAFESWWFNPTVSKLNIRHSKFEI